MNIPAKFGRVGKDRIYYFLVLAFSFTLPLSRTAITVFLILSILLWMVRGEFKKKITEIRRDKTLTAIAIFVLFQISTIFYSSDLEEGANAIKYYMYWLLIFILPDMIRREWIPKIINAYLAGAVVSAGLSYMILLNLYTAPSRSSSPLSPIMHHIDYSIFLAVAAIISFLKFLSSSGRPLSRIGSLLTFLFVTGILFLAPGRTGQLALILSILVFTVIRFWKRKNVLLGFFLLISLLVASIYFSVTPFQNRVNQAVNDLRVLKQYKTYNTSLGLRIAFANIAYDIFQKHPLLGVGIGDFKHALKEGLKNTHMHISNVNRTRYSRTHFHNQYLMVLVQSGLIGLFLMFYMFYRLLTLKIDMKEYQYLPLLFYTVYAIGFLAEPLWIKQFPLALFTFFTGLLIMISTQRDTDNISVPISLTQPT